MPHYLFVYGTLMQDHHNPYTELIQQNSKLIGTGFIYAQKFDLGEYPGIKLDSKKQYKTTGELYHINTNIEDVLTELDFYEGYYPENTKGSLFIRKEVTVFTEVNMEYKSWVYEYTGKV